LNSISSAHVAVSRRFIAKPAERFQLFKNQPDFGRVFSFVQASPTLVIPRVFYSPVIPSVAYFLVIRSGGVAVVEGSPLLGSSGVRSLDSLRSLGMTGEYGTFGMKETVLPLGMKETVLPLGMKETVLPLGMKETVLPLGMKETVLPLGMMETVPSYVNVVTCARPNHPDPVKL
jgi:hypothetical protein